MTPDLTELERLKAAASEVCSHDPRYDGCPKCVAFEAYDEALHAAAGSLLAAARRLGEVEAGCERVSAAELLRQGGEWLGAARNWLKWHKRNGDQVDWGSNDVLEGPFTVREVEDLAADVAAAAMAPQPTKAFTERCLRARWKAEQKAATAEAQLTTANARIAELDAADCGNLPCSDDCNLVRLAAKLKAGAAAERRVAELEIAIDVARKNESDAHHKRGEALEQLTAATARAEAVERARDAREEWLGRMAQAVGYAVDAQPADVLQRIDDAVSAERARDEALKERDEWKARATELERVSNATIAGMRYAQEMAEQGERFQRERADMAEAQRAHRCADCEETTRVNGEVCRQRDEALQRAEAAEKSASKIAIEAIEAAAKLSLATGGTSACPICGIDQVHAHTKEDVEAWATRQVARWGYIASLGPTPPRAQVETELVQTLEELRSRGPACPSCGSHGACNESCAIELALRLFYERDPQGRVDG